MSEIIPQPVPATPVDTQLSPYLSKAKSLWNSSQRNLVLSAALAAIVAAIIVVALWSSAQNYRPLYGNQERFDTGEIVSVLESEGIHYRLQEENGQVLVEERGSGSHPDAAGSERGKSPVANRPGIIKRRFVTRYQPVYGNRPLPSWTGR